MRLAGRGRNIIYGAETVLRWGPCEAEDPMRTILIILGLAGLVVVPACQKEKKKAELSQTAEAQGARTPVEEAGGSAAPAAPATPAREAGAAAGGVGGGGG